MKIKSAKAKGNKLTKDYKELILNYFHGPLKAADVDRTTSGEPGMDIKGSSIYFKLLPFCTECKNNQTISVWRAYAQACDYIKPGLMPLAIMKKNRSDTLAVLKVQDFLQLMHELAMLKYPELFNPYHGVHNDPSKQS